MPRCRRLIDVRPPIRKLSGLGIVAACLAMAPAGSASPWNVDPVESEIVVQTDRGGFLSFAGHQHVIVADRFGGTIVFDPVEPDNSSIELSIEAASLRVADEDKPEDVPRIQAEMETSVLEVDAHPEIGFRSSAIDVKESDGKTYALEVRGILRLHGKSRVVKLDVMLALAPDTEESAGDHVILAAETVIRQTDYGITPVSVGLGAVKVKDEVKLRFHLVGKPPSSSSPDGDPR